MFKSQKLIENINQCDNKHEGIAWTPNVEKPVVSISIKKYNKIKVNSKSESQSKIIKSNAII